MAAFLPFIVGSTYQIESSGVLEFHTTDDSSYDPYSNSCETCLVCLKYVPAYMIPGELINFFQSSLQYIQSFRIYRHYSEPDKFLAVILLDSVDHAKQFVVDYNGELMSSIDNNTHCDLHFIKDVSLSNSSGNSIDLALLQLESKLQDHDIQLQLEEERCPVCLDVISQTNPISFTTCCQHKFHIDCIYKLEGPQCPVCRYQHDSSSSHLSECFTCGWQGVTDPYQPTSMDSIQLPSLTMNCGRDLWMCLICGYTGCGRAGSYHIKDHYEETLHTYAMNTDNRRVWDFAGDGYVHRLILNGPNTTGWENALMNANSMKVVEVNQNRSNSSDMMRDSRAPLTSEQEELIVNRKLESAAYHYNQLLAWQMQQNRLSYETRLQKIRDSVTHNNKTSTSNSKQSANNSNNRHWKDSIMQSLKNEKSKALKLVETAQDRLSKAREELEINQELHKNLERNLTDAQSKVQLANQRYVEVQSTHRKGIPELEKKVQLLMEKLDMVHHSDTGARNQSVTTSTETNTIVGKVSSDDF